MSNSCGLTEGMLIGWLDLFKHLLWYVCRSLQIVQGNFVLCVVVSQAQIYSFLGAWQVPCNSTLSLWKYIDL